MAISRGQITSAAFWRKSDRVFNTTHFESRRCSTHLIMDAHRRKCYILVVTDSRGAWLHREFRRYQTHLLKFSVIYRRGAGLETLWEIIEWNILSKNFDYVFLLGGVCNITDKITINGRREFWPPQDLDGRFSRIHQLIRDIAKNFKLLKTGAKLILLPEPGLDLIRVNRIPHPVPWRALVIQSEIEDRLELLHLYTRAINSYLGVITPWSLDLTHSYRNHEIHPVYERLPDGLHFSGAQVARLARILAEYVENDIAKSRFPHIVSSLSIKGNMSSLYLWGSRMRGRPFLIGLICISPTDDYTYVHMFFDCYYETILSSLQVTKTAWESNGTISQTFETISSDDQFISLVSCVLLLILNFTCATYRLAHHKYNAYRVCLKVRPFCVSNVFVFIPKLICVANGLPSHILDTYRSCSKVVSTCHLNVNMLCKCVVTVSMRIDYFV